VVFQHTQLGTMSTRDYQTIPINMYVTSSNDLVITAPVPGLESSDLEITVHDTTVTIFGKMRGPGQQEREYLVHEWSYGPYRRIIELPFPVDADHANASLGNGVLVLSLPRSSSTLPHQIKLQHVAADRGKTQGHSGHHSTRQGLSEQS
jgi:HSP20 family protein